MKITDIIRSVLDLVDSAECPEEEVTQIAIEIPVPVEPQIVDDPLSIMKQLAGLQSSEHTYSNSPAELIAPLSAATPGGDDMHHSKNPADIRTNAPSMYPNFQAKD